MWPPVTALIPQPWCEWHHGVIWKEADPHSSCLRCGVRGGTGTGHCAQMCEPGPQDGPLVWAFGRQPGEECPQPRARHMAQSPLGCPPHCARLYCSGSAHIRQLCVGPVPGGARDRDPPFRGSGRCSFSCCRSAELVSQEAAQPPRAPQSTGGHSRTHGGGEL